METLDRTRREPAASSLHCCCGHADCLLLKRNCSILESVEKDVHTAAQLGQALLARHEAYMADAERDRLRLTARIERLELDKQELEAENATKIEENSNLLEQLELLNNTVSDADAKIRSLESSLLFSQQAVRRLESAAARAADAEHHLRILEEEQDRLHGELRTTKEEARSHAQRFKEAQRGILDMQDQLERMEKEARQERERHSEMMEKAERQRDVEKQLDAAALRLKGAAASKSITEHRQGNKIVGNFVRDLLQDNANLQLGMAELREMLIHSHDEIQSLREQLMFHQPASQFEAGSPASTLKAELEPLQDPPVLSQELHIHHHYHVTNKQDNRKSKRKRHGLLPGVFTPPALPSRSSSPGPWSQRRFVSSPTAPALLSHAHGEATPIMVKPSSLWNGFSTSPSELSSSVPSSPQSNSHGFFDHSMAEPDLTSPTTSYDPMSPLWRASHKKRISEASSCSFQSLSIIDSEHSASGARMSHHGYAGSTILEEEEDGQYMEAPRMGNQASFAGGSMMDDSERPERAVAPPGPKLHRVTSHESIMSLTGGLDIHTLKVRPSQMTLRPLGGADAVVTGVIAQPTLSRGYAKRSDVALRDSFAGFQIPKPVASTASEAHSSPLQQQSRASTGGLGKWVGWRPWGGGSNANSNTGGDASKSVDKGDKDSKRASGINQPGTVPGFQQYWATQKRKGAPAKVTAETIDREALSESLRDGGFPDFSLI